MGRPRATLKITVAERDKKEILVVEKNLMMHYLLNTDFTNYERYSDRKLGGETGDDGFAWEIQIYKIFRGVMVTAEPATEEAPEPIDAGSGGEREFYDMLYRAVKEAGMKRIVGDVIEYLHYYVVAVWPSVVITTPEIAVLNIKTEVPLDSYMGTEFGEYTMALYKAVIETAAGPLIKEVTAKFVNGRINEPRVIIAKGPNNYERRRATYVNRTIINEVVTTARHLGLADEADILINTTL